MENKSTEGEKLLLLVRRNKMQNKDLAKILNIEPSSVSRIYRSKRLSKKVRDMVITGLNLPTDYFSLPGDAPIVLDTPAQPEANPPQTDDLKRDIAELKKEVERLVSECHKRGVVEDRLLNIIEQLTKK